jgi:hypothetical protein
MNTANPTPAEKAAYAAGQHAYHAGVLLKDNPIKWGERPAIAALRDWWEEGWCDAQRQAGEEQTP